MAPDLNIPSSTSTVTVRMIDTTSYGFAPIDLMLRPKPVPGKTSFHFICFSFLITNNQTGEHAIFDIGIRKDWQTGYPPAFYSYIGDKGFMKVSVEKDIKDILETDNNFPLSNIKIVIWSHQHFDHRGDMTIFPSATKLIIGPDTLSTYGTYPSKPDAELHEDQLKGREVIELTDKHLTLTIGDYPAYDLFGDGSFYLMHSPGHTAGHLSALARVTSNPDTFILLGGDCCHHPAQFRPSPLSPVPDSISLLPTTKAFSSSVPPEAPIPTTRTITACPGAYISKLHRNQSFDEPFYDLLPNGINHNYANAISSRDKMMAFDAHPDVLVIIAHDVSVLGFLPLYPESLNDWKRYVQEKRPRKSSERKEMDAIVDKWRWEFLGEFDLEEK
jgi:glyoxylase-like metal-dependent hydrolase (beta-lactamase superfamily II)